MNMKFMRKREYCPKGVPGRLAIILFVFIVLITGTISYAEDPIPLSEDEAIRFALESNPGIESAHWDWLAARSKEAEAGFSRIPSLTFSAGYQRLSPLPPTSIDMENPLSPGSTITFEYPEQLTNVFSLRATLGYPVFAGFRIKEAIKIAGLKTESKAITEELIKRSLIFEVQRAYWEAVQADNNVKTLRKNLELMQVNRDRIQDLFE
jgi:outer membrane protein